MTIDTGDGRHVPKSLLTAPGNFVQFGANHTLTAVTPGTAGQVPTYGADGTLAPASAGGGATDIYVKTGSLFGSTVASGATSSATFDTPDVNIGTHITPSGATLSLAPGLYEIVAFAAVYKAAAAETIKIKSVLNANTWDQSSQTNWREILTGDPGNESSLRFRSILFSTIINVSTTDTIGWDLTNNSATLPFNVDTANFRVVRLGTVLA